MSFLQTNVCTSERTPHDPALMHQVSGRGYADLMRTPLWRSSRLRERSHRAAPTGCSISEGNAHIAGYYVSYVQVCRLVALVYIRQPLRYRGGAIRDPDPRLAPPRGPPRYRP